MIPTRIDTHEDDAKATLTDAWRDKAVVSAIVGVFAKRSQLLEGIVWGVLLGRLLDNAAGVHLDNLGILVGAPREGRLDDAYREVIRLRIRVNRSMGGSIDVTEVAQLIDPDAYYGERYPAAWRVVMYELENDYDAITLLTQTKAVGTYGVLSATTRPRERVFRFDHASAPMGDRTFDSVAVGSTIDKRFAAALPTNPGYVRSRT